MANHLAIATVSEALRLRLTAAIQPSVAGVDVATRRPAATDGAQSPQVTAFLYRVTPNAALRNSDLPTRGVDGADLRRRPRVALDLHYLLSFSGDDAAHEPQRMLGLAAASLHAGSGLTRGELLAAGQSAPALATSDLADELESVRFCLGDLSLDDLSKLWSVIVQIPYHLSVAYCASVVLIEADAATREPLPVRAPGLDAVPARQPVVDRVRLAGAAPPVLELLGRDLRGPATAVRIDGGEPRPAATATATRVTVPVGDVPAGVHGVQVVHEIPLGDPPVLHRGVESAAAAFVLRPAVAVHVDQDVVVATFTPPLAAGQRVALLLNEDPAPADRLPRFHRLEPAAPPAAGATVVRVSRVGVSPGAYLVRAQVDGVESLLDVAARPPAPRVVLP